MDYTSRILLRDVESSDRLIDILERLSEGKIRLSGSLVRHMQGSENVPPLCVDVVYKEIPPKETLEEEQEREGDEKARARWEEEQEAPGEVPEFFPKCYGTAKVEVKEGQYNEIKEDQYNRDCLMCSLEDRCRKENEERKAHEEHVMYHYGEARLEEDEEDEEDPEDEEE